LARTVWFIASEAAANAVKHAGASQLHVELVVDSTTATLRINDDGCGGMTGPPRAITARVTQAGGNITVTSPIGGGTDLVAVFERTTSVVAA
jgi:signal transduction histidine kinase